MKKIVLCCIMLLGLLGCEKETPLAEAPTAESAAGTMLLDYYEQVVVENAGYDEIVLSGDTATQALLDVYHRQSADSDEQHRRYRVPVSVVDEVFSIVEQYDMAHWQDESNLTGIDGKLYVCKFRKDGKYIRTTSEEMPENGMRAYTEIYHILSAYLRVEYEIPD